MMQYESDNILHAPRAHRGLVAVAALCVAVIAAGAFSWSFIALRDLAIRAGGPAQIAWVWPVIVDGFIITAMVVLFAMRNEPRRVTVWPWITFGLFAVISIVGNAVHTSVVVDGSAGIPVWVAMAVGAVPPVALLLASELLVRLAGGTRNYSAVQAQAASVTAEVEREITPEPEPEPEPDPAPQPPRREPSRPGEASDSWSTRPVSPSESRAVSLPVVTDEALPVAGVDEVGVPTAPFRVPVASERAAVFMPAVVVEETCAPVVTEPVAELVVPVVSEVELAPVATPDPVSTPEPEPEPEPAPPVLDPVPVPEPVAESVAESVPSNEEEVPVSAPVVELVARPARGWKPEVIPGEGIPEDAGEQVQWLVQQLTAGRTFTPDGLAELLGVSIRTARRRLTAANDFVNHTSTQAGATAAANVTVGK